MKNTEKDIFDELIWPFEQKLEMCGDEIDTREAIAMLATILAIRCNDEVHQQISYLIYIQMRLERVIQKLRREGGEDCEAKGVVASDTMGGGGEC